LNPIFVVGKLGEARRKGIEHGACLVGQLVGCPVRKRVARVANRYPGITYQLASSVWPPNTLT
jgi:hypothetical protein